MHTAYISSRQSILTRVTLKTPPQHHLAILTSAAVVEVRLKDEFMTPSPILHSALKSLCAQLSINSNHLQLKVDECIRLRWLKDVVGWTLDGETPRYCTVPEDDNHVYWHRHTLYHVLHVGQTLEWDEKLKKEMHRMHLKEQCLRADRTGIDPPNSVQMEVKGVWARWGMDPF